MTIEHTFMCLEAFMFAMHQHLNEPNWSFVNFPNDFQQIFDKVSKNFLNLIEENFFPELLNASELNSGSMDMSSYDGSQSPRSGGAMTPNSRNKRMRTSFKHHQLRTMKSYFAINQNPDAKDLKQLAQKTGLSKRVLQVGIPRLSMSPIFTSILPRFGSKMHAPSGAGTWCGKTEACKIRIAPKISPRTHQPKFTHQIAANQTWRHLTLMPSKKCTTWARVWSFIKVCS